MATVTTITSDFKGVPAGEIITQIFKEANTIKDGLISVIPNIVGSGFLRKTYVGDGLMDYACGFNPSGSLSLTEKEVAPKKLKVNLEICKETFRGRWSAAQMGFSAWNDQIPADESEALMLDLSNGISAKIDAYIWHGVGANPGQFQGLITQWVDPLSTSGKIDSVPSTTANVIAEMGKVIDLTPDEVISRDDLVFGVSRNIYKNYVRVLNPITANFQHDSTYFDNIKVSVINGLNADTMVTYPSSNVFFLTGLQSDLNEVKIKDMDDTDLSGTIRVAMVFTAGVAAADDADVVVYNSQVTP
jgi:hypothetical protein